MPNFNYENPTDIHGNSLETPQEQLFLRAMDILAYDGFASLTKETLMKRGVDAQLLETYSGSEAICEAVLLDAAERIETAYASITEEAKAYLMARKYTRDEGFKQLERMLYRHIYLCFHPKNRVFVLVGSQENRLPQGLYEILPRALQRSFGDILTQMILCVSEVKNAPLAATISCTILGSIQAFVQQPEYCRALFVGGTREKPNYAVVEDYLNNYFLRAIAANTAINKPF